jgi:D-alanine-D-alanine ligase
VLLQGGNSEERDISLKSSAAIKRGLLEIGYEVTELDPHNFISYWELGSKLLEIDPYIVFNGLHGGDGEDGTVQALLSLLNIPFTGTGMKGSALCMDKAHSYSVATAIGIRVPPYLCLNREQSYDIFKIGASYNFPLVIKPNESGSSVGISIVTSYDQITPAIAEAFQYSDRVIIQKFIAGSELAVSVLGDETLPIVEIKVKEGWYDFTNKYTEGKSIYEVPATLSEEMILELQTSSLAIYNTFDCKAYARVDFRYDGTEFYFLEVNTLPGMTELSLTPMAAEKAGIPFPKLLEKIIQLSLS